MKQHTPGPWRPLRDLPARGNRWVITEDDRTFGVYATHRLACMEDYRGFSFGPPDTEQEANACLMAAAPDLLEACKPIATWLGAFRDRDEQLGNLDMESIDRLRAAIAKAEGD